MFTSTDFRRIALGMKEAVEGAHMGHPDFRANGRIFASLSGDEMWGNVKLTPEEQRRFVEDDPETFAPAAGAWGAQGWTRIRLATATEDVVGEALTIAWQLTAAGRKASGRTGAKSVRHGRGRR
jgi:hypothetical protein